MPHPSLIATPDGAAHYVANTVHPGALWEIVRRDGVRVARHALVNTTHGWQHLDATQSNRLHPHHAGDPRLAPVVGYGVSHAGLDPITDWRSIRTTLLCAVFVLAGAELRITATGLDLAIPYADPSPNWTQFDHVVLAGPPPTLHLVTSVDHPSHHDQ